MYTSNTTAPRGDGPQDCSAVPNSDSNTNSTSSARIFATRPVEDGIQILGFRLDASGIDEELPTRLVFPSHIEGAPVVSIGPDAFCKSPITYIELPETVTRIEARAFWQCRQLEDLVLTDSVDLIGSHAFCQCSRLERVCVNGRENPQEKTSPTGLCALLDPSIIAGGHSGVASSHPGVASSHYDSRSDNHSDSHSDGYSNGHSNNRQNASAPWMDWDDEDDTHQNDADNDNPCTPSEPFPAPVILPPGTPQRSQITDAHKHAQANAQKNTDVNVASVDSLSSHSKANTRRHEYPRTRSDGSSLDTPGSICYRAFHECNSLRSVVLPQRIEHLAGLVFGDCPELHTVIFNDNLCEVGASAFFNCTSLTHVELPRKVFRLGVEAFAGCTNLRSLYLPNNITCLPNRVLRDCTSLEHIHLPKHLDKIGRDALWNCRSLRQIRIPASVSAIESYAFWNCANLESFVFAPDSRISAIGSGALALCSSLHRVDFPPSLDFLSVFAFDGCDALVEGSAPGVPMPRYNSAHRYLSLELMFLCSHNLYAHHFWPGYIEAIRRDLEQILAHITNTHAVLAFCGLMELNATCNPPLIPTSDFAQLIVYLQQRDCADLVALLLESRNKSTNIATDKVKADKNDTPPSPALEGELI